MMSLSNAKGIQNTKGPCCRSNRGQYFLKNPEGIQNTKGPCCRSNRGQYFLKNSEGIQNTKGPCCRSNRGQSSIEYILLVSAVLIVLIVFLNPTGVFTQRIEGGILNKAVEQVNSISNDIQF